MGLRKLLLFGVVLLTVFWSCSDLGDPLQVPEIEVSPSTLNFNSIPIGDTTEVTLQISNNGTLELILDSLRITGIDSADFYITNKIADGTEIVPKGDLDITIQFIPSSQDDKTAVLNIFSNDPNNSSLIVSFTVGDVQPQPISYSTQIQPIFSANCTGCHGGLGGLVLTSYTNLMAGGNSGAVVLANNGSGSLIIQKLRGEDIPAMPYNDSYPLESSLIDSIETWINEGAQNN